MSIEERRRFDAHRRLLCQAATERVKESAFSESGSSWDRPKHDSTMGVQLAVGMRSPTGLIAINNSYYE